MELPRSRRGSGQLYAPDSSRLFSSSDREGTSIATAAMTTTAAPAGPRHSSMRPPWATVDDSVSGSTSSSPHLGGSHSSTHCPAPAPSSRQPLPFSFNTPHTPTCTPSPLAAPASQSFYNGAASCPNNQAAAAYASSSSSLGLPGGCMGAGDSRPSSSQRPARPSSSGSAGVGRSQAPGGRVGPDPDSRGGGVGGGRTAAGGGREAGRGARPTEAASPSILTAPSQPQQQGAPMGLAGAGCGKSAAGPPGLRANSTGRIGRNSSSSSSSRGEAGLLHGTPPHGELGRPASNGRRAGEGGQVGQTAAAGPPPAPNTHPSAPAPPACLPHQLRQAPARSGSVPRAGGRGPQSAPSPRGPGPGPGPDGHSSWQQQEEEEEEEEGGGGRGAWLHCQSPSPAAGHHSPAGGPLWGRESAGGPPPASSLHTPTPHTPTPASTGTGAAYAGPGLALGGPPSRSLQHPSSSTRAAATTAMEVATLQAQNAALQAQVQQLQQLLGVYQEGQQQSAEVSAAQSTAVLARYRSQLWQLQRQVVLMGLEMQAAQQVVSEAEGALAELQLRLEGLAVRFHPSTSTSTEGQEPAGDSAKDLANLALWAKQTGQRLRSARRQAASTTTRSSLQQQQQQQQQQWQLEEEASSWGAGPRPTSSHRLPAKPSHPAAGGGSLRHGLEEGEEGAGGMGAGGGGVPRWQLAYVPCGGNRFLAAASAALMAQGTTPSPAAHDPAPSPQEVGEASQACLAAALRSVSTLCSGSSTALLAALAAAACPPTSSHQQQQRRGQGQGQGQGGMPEVVLGVVSSLAARPSAAALLEQQLVGLAPKLTRLAVLLRSTLLPALHWLSVEAADRLQTEVAETAAATHTTACGLAELGCLLPSGGVTLAAAAAGNLAAARGAEVQGGRDAWLWGSEGLVEDQAVEREQRARERQAALLCGADLEQLVGSLAPLLRDKKAGGVRQCRDVVASCLAAPLLATAGKLEVLDMELRFATRAVALQAQHVAQFMTGAYQAPPPTQPAAPDPPDHTNPDPEPPHQQRVQKAQQRHQGPGLGSCAVGALAALEAVRRVLEAQQQLLTQPSEAAVAQLVGVVGECRPGLMAAELSLLGAGGRSCRVPDAANGDQGVRATDSSAPETTQRVLASHRDTGMLEPGNPEGGIRRGRGGKVGNHPAAGLPEWTF